MEFYSRYEKKTEWWDVFITGRIDSEKMETHIILDTPDMGKIEAKDSSPRVALYKAWGKYVGKKIKYALKVRELNQVLNSPASIFNVFLPIMEEMEIFKGRIEPTEEQYEEEEELRKEVEEALKKEEEEAKREKEG